MRILLDYRPALAERTGVGEYTHEMATALARLLPERDRLTLFSSSWKDRLQTGRVPGASVVDARVPVRVLNFAWHRIERPRVELFAGPIDIAHSSHPLLMPARHAGRLVTIYDLFFLTDAAGTAPEIRRDYPALAGTHARRADAVVVISRYTASAVETHLGVPADRLVLCPPGAPDWPRREAWQPSGPILCLGSAERRKNVPALLRAYGRLRAQWPEVPPLILAGRPPATGSAIERMLQAPELAGRVEHRGYVTEAERRRLFAAASVLVVPSLDEGFGMPALEAMAIGLPVVVADRGALPEVSGDAARLVDPLDEASIAAGMRQAPSDTAGTLTRIERGFARAAAYSWRASAARLLEAYHHVHAMRHRHA
ncbi:MAG TPA: glycosyltransferase family 1 protein [Vicinamibacterales bacterium]|nr:glycosyltransferase family 1 protein [Vicinamibacterales bacterium]